MYTGASEKIGRVKTDWVTEKAFVLSLAKWARNFGLPNGQANKRIITVLQFHLYSACIGREREMNFFWLPLIHVHTRSVPIEWFDENHFFFVCWSYLSLRIIFLFFPNGAFSVTRSIVTYDRTSNRLCLRHHDSKTHINAHVYLHTSNVSCRFLKFQLKISYALFFIL